MSITTVDVEDVTPSHFNRISEGQMKKYSCLLPLSVSMLSLALSPNILTAQVVVVDGQKDAFYGTLTGPNDGYLQIKSYAFNDNGIPTGDTDLSAKVWTAWDNNWFYLYEEVADDTLAANATNVWEEDEIELKFDPQPTDSVTNSVWDTRFTALAPGPGIVNGDSLNNVADSLKQWVRKLVPGGYVLELAIKWSAIRSGNGETITPAAGNVFGMAVNQHDNDGRARRQASIMWAATMLDAVWNTPKYHGTVKFLADNKLQFIPQNNVATVRTNKIPYDGTPFYLRIDGRRDPFYASLAGPNDGYLQVKSYAFNDNGIPTGDADLSAKVWTAWDDKWFYLYQEVRDDTLSGNATNVWEEDEIELKFDPQPTDSVTNSVWDTRLTALGRVTAGVVNADSLNNVADSLKQWTRTRITGGYTLELAIRWSAIRSGNGETITPAAGNVFGMAINQHDNDGRARRQASIMWAATMLDAVWNTPKYHGTVKFLADNKLQFIPQNSVATIRTNKIPYDGTPFYLRIDGRRDPFYASLAGPNDGYLQVRSYAYNDNGRPANDADLSAKVWAGWDDKWFYLYEEVRDDTLSGNATNVWEEDEIELKFDPQPTDSVTNSVWDTRLTALGRVTAGVVNADSLNNVADSLKKWIRTRVTGGYNLELAIRWSAIRSGNGETVTPAANNVFGMAINQHDNDGRARRQASIMWAAVMLDAVWNTPKYHGTVKFLADNKLQFIPKNNVTGRTNSTPYDGSDITGVEEKEDTSIPLVYDLSQNYPNPFNPETQIQYSLKKGGQVSLRIYDIMGQLVATLVDEKQAAGHHQVQWNGRNDRGIPMSTGIYFYRLQAGEFVRSYRMLLMK